MILAIETLNQEEFIIIYNKTLNTMRERSNLKVEWSTVAKDRSASVSSSPDDEYPL